MTQTDFRNPTDVPRLVRGILAWIIAVILAVGFAFFGGIKLASRPGMVQEFAQIGIGQWLRYVTGILEVSGAIGVLIPKVRFWAALQIAMVMIGATFTNVVVLHAPALARLTAILMGLALALAWLRRPHSVARGQSDMKRRGSSAIR